MRRKHLIQGVARHRGASEDRVWIRGSAARIAAALLLTLGFEVTAHAGDKIYWATFNEGIRVGNLDGSGTAQFIGPNYANEGQISGEVIAIDPAANKIYWANWGQNAIRVGNLDGTGMPESLYTGEEGVQGLAIDPVAGKIYWSTHYAAVRNNGVPDPRGMIRVGNLDGSGTPKTLYRGELGPNGLTIDPAVGKLYWTSGTSGYSSIKVANSDGTGKVKELYVYSNPGQVGPKPTDRTFVGEAIDIRSGKIYFTNWNGHDSKGGIMVANLDGSGTPQYLGPNYINGEAVPYGMAIDPTANKIYWSNSNTLGIGPVRVGNLDGSGMPMDLFAGERTPHMPSLLKAPVGTRAPKISGNARVGSRLFCSQGIWEGDLPTAHLYRAARTFSYQWFLNGAPIHFASSKSYTPAQPGTYTCQVTASNHAGSSVQVSRETNVDVGR